MITVESLRSIIAICPLIFAFIFINARIFYFPDIKVIGKGAVTEKIIQRENPKMEIIGAGFCRSGTMSTQKALQDLGFAPCYHMKGSR